MFKKIQLNPNEKTILEVKGTGRSLFLLNLDGNMVIMPGDLLEELKIKKGSVSLRVDKGMKMRNAIKDLIVKAKPQKTECLIIDLLYSPSK